MTWPPPRTSGWCWRLQEKYESERNRREIELLNRQNALHSAELENKGLRDRVGWLFAAVFVISLGVIIVFYRKLRANNGLLAQRNRELSVHSSRDPLTALYNRRHFQDFMRDAPARPERRSRSEPDSPIHALLLIDIDLFKQTNDRYGHAAGDAVLVDVAHRLRDTLRETDMIVRWGGEEFLVFVPATSPDKLAEIAVRVMAAVAAEPIVYQGNRIRVTASIGYAPMPLPPENIAIPWERAIGLADMALYMAKLDGRNCAYGIRRLRRSDDEAMERIERDLQSAWANGMVEMHLERGPALGTTTAPKRPARHRPLWLETAAAEAAPARLRLRAARAAPRCVSPDARPRGHASTPARISRTRGRRPRPKQARDGEPVLGEDAIGGPGAHDRGELQQHEEPPRQHRRRRASCRSGRRSRA